MVDIITEMMVEEQIKKIVKYVEENKDKVLKRINIAMIVIIAIIAIILIDVVYKRQKKWTLENQNRAYKVNEIKFVENDDETIYKFISNYFTARKMLNFPKIFASYGRDYYKEKREDEKNNVKEIEDDIRYEKTFVRGYENIKIYIEEGLRIGEKVCLVAYDLALGFTDGKAPMLIIFYLVPSDGTYIIKENLDVGTSKYLIDCMNTQQVKEIYEDVETRLVRLLASSESLKLAYNSLRQYEMNKGGDVNYEKNRLIDNFGIVKLDPIKDADEIYSNIIEIKNEEKIKKEMDEYIEKVVDSIKNPKNISTISDITNINQ